MIDTDMTFLLGVARAFREIARILRRNEEERVLRSFYGKLMTSCLLVADLVKDHANSSDPLTYQLLDRFQSWIVIDSSHASPSHKEFAPSYERLRAFRDHWNRLVHQNERDKLSFVSCRLNFGSTPDQRDELLEYLEIWVDNFSTLSSESTADWSTDTIILQRSTRYEPSHAVWAAAQELYNALVASRKCNCEPDHEHGVRLRLKTYRQPDNDEELSHDEIIFDMFLASQDSWQEAQVLTRKQTMAKFTLDDGSRRDGGMSREKRMRVKALCDLVKKSKDLHTYHLRFMVEQGLLWKLQSMKSINMIDLSKTPTSLESFITERPGLLTEKTKRVLAVLLGYAIFHLYNTAWLRSAFGSSNIVFFETKSGTTPLRPFIHTHLVEPGNEQQVDPAGCEPNENDSDGYDPDDDLVSHPCPSLVSLAVTLLELYFALPFPALAETCKMDWSANVGNAPRLFEVDLVFQHRKPDIHSGFVTAIDNCLNPNLWQDEDCQPLKELSVKGLVYEKVVQPLEEELSRGFSYISLERLDSEAQMMDFTKWGQSILNDNSDSKSQLSLPVKSARYSSHHPSPYRSNLSLLNHSHGDVYSRSRRIRTDRIGDFANLSFFDDEIHYR